MMHSGISQAREFDDPPGLHEKTEFLLRDWVNMYHSPAAGRDSCKAFSAFVGQVSNPLSNYHTNFDGFYGVLNFMELSITHILTLPEFRCTSMGS